jgi:UDP-N-acetylglucosamine diphosphorylase/glucosamine-1-phosphate N-acetyltransferase
LPVNRPAEAGSVLVNGRWLLSGPQAFHEAPYVGRCGDALAYIACDARLAALITPEMLLSADAVERLAGEFPSGEVEASLAGHVWDLTGDNGAALRRHWTGDDRGSTGNVSSSAFLMNPDYIHVGDRTRVRPTAVIDATDGPVFISNDVRIDVHTYIEGPAYIGPGCILKPHTSIRAGTSLGSMCRVEGEISASIMRGHVNKQHHGFMGDSYVGSWVNLGAGTITSNLKNTYGKISAQLGARRLETGRQFAGCAIGDFSRTGIGQLLPTGAVVGFGAMVATGTYCPKYVPSYAWLTADGQSRTEPGKLREVISRMMERRRAEMSPEEERLFAKLPQIVEQCGV